MGTEAEFNEDHFFSLLEEQVGMMFVGENTGHDIYHLIRVRKLALKIQEAEGGDRLVIGVAAFLHDIHRAMQFEGGRYCQPEESLEMVADIIKRAGGLPSDKVEMILHCIEFHEQYGFNAIGKTVNDLETLIVQDADNLDANGAMGISRTFTYSGAHGIPMHLPDVPLVGRENYTEDENDPSVLCHIQSKILRLRDDMNTATARVMAEDRHIFVELFKDRFLAEWNGLV